MSAGGADQQAACHLEPSSAFRAPGVPSSSFKRVLTLRQACKRNGQDWASAIEGPASARTREGSLDRELWTNRVARQDRLGLASLALLVAVAARFGRNRGLWRCRAAALTHEEGWEGVGGRWWAERRNVRSPPLPPRLVPEARPAGLPMIRRRIDRLQLVEVPGT